MIYRINWRLEEDMMGSYEFRVEAGSQKQAVSIFREVHPEGKISYIAECDSL